MTQRKILFIANPASGRGKSVQTLPLVAVKMREHPSIYYRTYISEGAGSIKLQVQKAFEEGYREFVAIGGDGTISEIINGLTLVKNDSPTVGIIPAGSGNDLARAFKVDIETSLEDIVRNNTRFVDVGVINNNYFINSCSFGIDGPITKEAYRLKKKYPGKLSYLAAVLKNLSTFKPTKVTIKMDNQIIETEVLTVAVSNGPYFGGGMKVAPLSKINDGLLDLTIIKPMSGIKLLKSLPKLYTGKIHDVDAVSHYQVKSLEILPETDLMINIDGDVVGLTPAKIDIIDGGIKVFSSEITNNIFYQ